MDGTSLYALAEAQLEIARTATSGRAAVTVYGGHEHRLRQTLIALCAGTRLGEHDAPDEATLLVIDGDVALHAGSQVWNGHAGDHVILPPQRHDLEAISDSAVLLTVAT
ncbi:LuxR family transcriptional regulator [Nocardioides ginsengisoli]|uniref:LuxR family transcriptional regulator n=1 Tax=Nocardioides ginsengisoli TaxID=363868 RepID=A0ABW3VVM1_9ACTN